MSEWGNMDVGTLFRWMTLATAALMKFSWGAMKAVFRVLAFPYVALSVRLGRWFTYVGYVMSAVVAVMAVMLAWLLVMGGLTKNSDKIEWSDYAVAGYWALAYMGALLAGYVASRFMGGPKYAGVPSQPARPPAPSVDGLDPVEPVQ